MPHSIDFVVPKGMEPVDVAETFSAYLQGSRSFNNSIDTTDQWAQGPYPKPGRPASWQLDDSNDYFLHVEGEKAHLDCRYDWQKPIIEAMMALFKLRFELEHEI